MRIYQRLDLNGPWSVRKGMEIYDNDGNELNDVVSVDHLEGNRVRLTHQQEVDHDDVDLIFLEEDELLPSEEKRNTEIRIVEITKRNGVKNKTTLASVQSIEMTPNKFCILEELYKKLGELK